MQALLYNLCVLIVLSEVSGAAQLRAQTGESEADSSHKAFIVVESPYPGVPLEIVMAKDPTTGENFSYFPVQECLVENTSDGTCMAPRVVNDTAVVISPVFHWVCRDLAISMARPSVAIVVLSYPKAKKPDITFTYSTRDAFLCSEEVRNGLSQQSSYPLAVNSRGQQPLNPLQDPVFLEKLLRAREAPRDFLVYIGAVMFVVYLLMTVMHFRFIQVGTSRWAAALRCAVRV